MGRTPTRVTYSRRNPITIAQWLAILASTLYCTEPIGPSATLPRPVRVPRAPTYSIEMPRLPTDSVDLPAEPGSPVSVSLFPFPEGVVVDITFRGQISFTSHPLAAPIHYSGPLDYKGIRVPLGTGCSVQATVVFSQISGVGNPFPNTTDCLIPRTMTDYTVRARVGGTGTAYRSAKPLGNTYPCDSIRGAGSQCYWVSGMQKIIVAPLAAALDFEGTYAGKRSRGVFVPRFVNDSNRTVSGYSMVVFTDSTYARGMPLKNNAHRWSFADSSDPGDPYWHKTTNTCDNGVLYCAVYVKETGTMTSDTRVNGTYQTGDVLVYCADTAAILNNDLVRQGLMAVNDSSGYPSRPTENRVERSFLILQDSLTPGAEPYVWFFPQSPNANICTVGAANIDFRDRPSNTRVLGGGHAHVLPTDEFVVCLDPSGQPKRDAAGNIIAANTLPGASDEDWNWVKLLNTPGLNPGTVFPFKEYIVRGNEVLVLDPSKEKGSELQSGGAFRWPVTGRCTWPKRSLYRPEM